MFSLMWLFPQSIELDNRTGIVPTNELFWLYVALCFAAAIGGFAYGRATAIRNSPGTWREPAPSNTQARMFLAALSLGIFGLANRMLVGVEAGAQTGGGWTGVITMYALFSQALIGGLCLAAIGYFQARTRKSLILMLILLAASLYDVLNYAKREALFAIVIAVAGAAFFNTKWRPNRVHLLLAVALGAVYVTQAGDLRKALHTGETSFSSAAIQSAGNYRFVNDQTGPYRLTEVGQAKSDFDYVNRTGQYDYGVVYWNAVVSQYVPGFLLGKDYKQSLMRDSLAMRSMNDRWREVEYGPGLTRTGFSDSYSNFGWLGWIVFGLIGFIFGLIFDRAYRGSVVNQYLYLTLIASGIKAMTHSTAEFGSAAPFILVTYFFVKASLNPRRGGRNRPALQVNS